MDKVRAVGSAGLPVKICEANLVVGLPVKICEANLVGWRALYMFYVYILESLKDNKLYIGLATT